MFFMRGEQPLTTVARRLTARQDCTRAQSAWDKEATVWYSCGTHDAYTCSLVPARHGAGILLIVRGSESFGGWDIGSL